MKNYRAQSVQNLALTKILHKLRKTSTPLICNYPGFPSIISRTLRLDIFTAVVTFWLTPGHHGDEHKGRDTSGKRIYG